MEKKQVAICSQIGPNEGDTNQIMNNQTTFTLGLYRERRNPIFPE